MEDLQEYYGKRRRNKIYRANELRTRFLVYNKINKNKKPDLCSLYKILKSPEIILTEPMYG